MRSKRNINRRLHTGESRDVLVEEHQGRFAIAPCHVAKQLRQCVEQYLLPAPQLALADERRTGLFLKSDVGLAVLPERLAGGLTLEHDVDVRKNVVA